MTALRATPARIALLDAVSVGAVTHWYPVLPDGVYDEWDLGEWRPDRGRSRYRKVTVQMHAMAAEGWVTLGDRHDPTRYKSPRTWELTDAGRAVLEEARKKATT